MVKLPHVKRFVDGVAVLHPRYYADPGPEGFYPELQYPTQTRLGVMWNQHLGKETYIQLNAVFMTGIERKYDREHVRGAFEIISSNVHGKHPDEMIAIIEFPSAQQAESAILFANSNSRLLGDGHFFARYADVNAKGTYAGSTKDILLVREEFALSSPYTPRVLRASPSTRLPPPLCSQCPPSYNENDFTWHAVGYSRDSFATKRPLSPSDRHWSSPSKRQSTEWDVGYGSRKYLAGLVPFRPHDRGYHPAWPDRDFSGPTQMTTQQQQLGLSARKEPHDSPDKQQLTLQTPSDALLLRITSPALPSPSSTLSSEDDLTKALEKSLAAVGQNISPVNLGKRPFTRKTDSNRRYSSGQYKRKGRGFKDPKGHRQTVGRGTRSQQDRRERMTRKSSKAHASPGHQQSHPERSLHDTKMGDDRVEARTTIHRHSRSKSSDLSLRLLEEFKQYTPSSVKSVDDDYPPEPRYLAISDDGNELIFASTYDAARQALSKPQFRQGTPLAKQRGLEVYIENELDDTSLECFEEIEVVEEDEKTGQPSPISDTAANIATKAAQESRDPIESAASTFQMPVDIGGLLSSLRDIFNPKQRIFERIQTVSSQPSGEALLLSDTPEKKPVLDDCPSIPDHSQLTEQQKPLLDDLPPLRQASPVSQRRGGKIYSISDLHPCVLQMLGLEKRWTFRGDLHHRWHRVTVVDSGVTRGQGLGRDSLEEGEIRERVMRLSKPAARHGMTKLRSGWEFAVEEDRRFKVAQSKDGASAEDSEASRAAPVSSGMNNQLDREIRSQSTLPSYVCCDNSTDPADKDKIIPSAPNGAALLVKCEKPAMTGSSKKHDIDRSPTDHAWESPSLNESQNGGKAAKRPRVIF
ncbi:hypothetical protein I317_07603 [Kwoniella heveanensis CBS 569]|nr:hypothetical protein I317_07603 [Kwoniella heveanensis CBS 569]